MTLITTVSASRHSQREAALQTETLKATATVIASLSGEAADRRDAAQAYAAIRAIGALPDVLYARVETADGRLLAETGAGARLSRDPKVGDGQEVAFLDTLRSRTVEVTVPITYARRDVGRVVLLGKLEGAFTRLMGGLLLSALAALAAVALGLAVAWRLQRKISAPIIALTSAMGGVRDSHDYTSVVEIESDDEVGDLVVGFNAMLAEVRTRDEAIAEHMAGLEQTVAERTADLRVARDAAEAANHAKSDFLATMSHEIRTPMNGVMVMAEMLAAGDMPPRQRRFAEVIAKSGASLLAIINDILDFSKIEAGKMELEAAPVDVAEVADDVASLFWEKARSKGIDLATFVEPAVPRLIEADAVRLRQVIGNLVNNAIKFTETGGVLIELTWPAEGRLRLAVHDTGIGISREKIPDLFSAFSQADQSTTRKFGGTGLGLAICKRLVEAMGGELSAKSVVGRGSVFFFECAVTALEPAAAWPNFDIPRSVELRVSGPSVRRALSRYLQAAGVACGDQGELVIGEASSLAERAGPGPVVCLAEYGDDTPLRLQRDGKVDAVLTQPLRRQDLALMLTAWRDGADLARAIDAGAVAERGQTASFLGRRVLVVDDSAVNREVAMEALSRLGVETLLANDGRAGVEAALSQPVDLVLMDGSMPDMDGYEATREIRRREAEDGRARLPVVALTAHVVGSAAEAWRDADMDAVLHKPFTLAGMARVLGQFLEPSAQAAPPPVEAAPPLPAASSASSDLLDPAVVAELDAMAAGGKQDFVARVRKLYRDNAPAALQRYVAATAVRDAEEGAAAAHALKSMSLNIGARAVAELCARLEADARERGLVEPVMAEELHRKLLATLQVLEGEPQGAPASEPSDENRALMADLAQAAERGELALVYQRQMGRDGETLCGLESLLRWRHPVRGDVSPAIFIPLAEQHGLIRSITRWVLDRAMEETADLGEVSVGVNVSAIEFSDPDFVDDVAAQLAKRRFEPARLEIEITETAVLSDGEEVRRTIARLHELGVKIALDDFGVGYSSLSHLRLFAFDKLKIDRAFVTDCATDMQSATLVHAVVSIGRSLGMKVVAEGIETPAQQKFLKLAGVHALQGYLFGRPVPIGELRALLSEAEAPRESARSASS